MTLEERLNELETAIQALRRDIKGASTLKFKVGDDVFLVGKIVDIDPDDIAIPYKIEWSGGRRWVKESELQPKAT